MSRGLGSIQRRLLDVIEQSIATLSTYDLCAAAFSLAPGLDSRILVTDVQIVSVRRALRKLAASGRIVALGRNHRGGRGRWDGLVRFLDDGRIEINSIIVKHAIRPIALNRKNAPFAGSDGGGEH